MDEFDQANTRIFAISYDPVADLRHFADQHGISYSLLSDEGSQVITRLGLLNLHVAEQQAAAGRSVEPRHTGIPYPGLFLLDESGTIIDKRFEQSYQARPAPDLMLEEIIGVEAVARAVSATARDARAQAVAWLGAPTYRPMQRLHLHVLLDAGPDLHVYGTPAPAGMTGLTVDVDPIEGVTAEPAKLPEPHRFEGPGFAEHMLVYEGAIGMTVPIQIATNRGDLRLGIDLHYQACSDSECFPPEALRLELDLRGLDNLRPEPSS